MTTTISVTFAGDPHVNTIDNGRYTCHIQGLYVFAKTTAVADFNARARTVARSEATDVLFEPDIFTINVFSVFIEAALPYVTRFQGYGSIFTNYTLIANNATFIIKNNNGKFGKQRINLTRKTLGENNGKCFFKF